MRMIFLLTVIFLLAGCGYQPTINAYEKIVGDAIDKGSDQDYAVKKFALCHTPYATLLTHPADFGWLNKLCAPGTSESTPDTMLQSTNK